MNDARASAVAAFLGDKISLDELGELHRKAPQLRLTFQGGLYTLDGDPAAMVPELVRLARVGLMVGQAAMADPTRSCFDVLAEVEAQLARTS